MKIFSTFSGIGGFEVGIDYAWMETEPETSYPIVVGYSEIDKYAIKVYEHQFKGVPNYGDITKINADELPDFDCLVGGFPCQAFSIAGKRKGFEDTRGTLFFDLARILRAKQPRLFVFENVKGLLSHDSGRTFKTIIQTIDELGYDCQWQVLNSKDFGVPQNRERVYIVGHLRGTPRPEVFPIASDYGETINESDSKGRLVRLTRREKAGYYDAGDSRASTLDANYYKGLANQERPGVVQPFTVSKIDRKNKEYTLKDTEISGTLTATMWKGIDALNRTGVKQPFVAAVLTPDRLEKRQNGRRIKENGEPAFTVTSADRHGVYDGVKIRRLTPKECERLQGFPDNWTAEGIDGAISDTQRYKMCGNAVTTNVVQAVFERILK